LTIYFSKRSTTTSQTGAIEIEPCQRCIDKAHNDGYDAAIKSVFLPEKMEAQRLELEAEIARRVQFEVLLANSRKII
jgi:hypothetical protein